MQKTIPSRIHYLLCLALVAALATASCGTDGDGDLAGSTTTASAAVGASTTTTAAPEDGGQDTTTATTEPEQADDDAGPEMVGPAVPMQIGEVLFEADVTDPNVGDLDASGVDTNGSQLMLTLERNTGVTFAPDPEFRTNVNVSAEFDVVRADSTPDASYGVACRHHAGGRYVGLATQTKADANRYTWGIAKVADGKIEVLDDSTGTAVTVDGAVLTVSLSCNYTSQGEILDLQVGDEFVGQVTDPEPLRGVGAGLYYQTDDYAGPAFVNSFRVFELVPA